MDCIDLLDPDTLHIVLSYLNSNDFLRFISTYDISINYFTLMIYKDYPIIDIYDYNIKDIYIGLLILDDDYENLFNLTTPIIVPPKSIKKNTSIHRYIIKYDLVNVYLPTYVSYIDDPQCIPKGIFDSNLPVSWVAAGIMYSSYNSLKYISENILDRERLVYEIIRYLDLIDFDIYKDTKKGWPLLKKMILLFHSEDADLVDDNITWDIIEKYSERMKKTYYDETHRYDDDFIRFIFNKFKGYYMNFMHIKSTYILNILLSTREDPYLDTYETYHLTNLLFDEKVSISNENRKAIFNKYCGSFDIRDLYDRILNSYPFSDWDD